jgi:hypothetical protein
VGRTKRKKKVKIKKRCCESKRRCEGCPLRPENRKRLARK